MKRKHEKNVLDSLLVILKKMISAEYGSYVHSISRKISVILPSLDSYTHPVFHISWRTYACG